MALKTVVPSFSARYLRQVQEEWLYVQSLRESRSGFPVVGASDSDKIAYPVYAQPGSDSEQGSHPGKENRQTVIVPESLRK